eukprot:m.32897 g.32897  ORF g.32897 m.32897 type:complete len:122 (-) comp5587_c0_seq3:54-419(-)
MAAGRLSRVRAQIAQLAAGGEATLRQMQQPSFEGGRWRPAPLSGRRIKLLAKYAAAEGITVPQPPPKPLATPPTRPNKGHRHQRLKAERSVSAAPALLPGRRQDTTELKPLFFVVLSFCRI